jgi:hypothetical protein
MAFISEEFTLSLVPQLKKPNDTVPCTTRLFVATATVTLARCSPAGVQEKWRPASLQSVAHDCRCLQSIVALRERIRKSYPRAENYLIFARLATSWRMLVYRSTFCRIADDI